MVRGISLREQREIETNAQPLIGNLGTPVKRVQPGRAVKNTSSPSHVIRSLPIQGRQVTRPVAHNNINEINNNYNNNNHNNFDINDGLDGDDLPSNILPAIWNAIGGEPNHGVVEYRDRIEKRTIVQASARALMDKVLPFMSTVGGIIGVQTGLSWRHGVYLAHDRLLPTLCSAGEQTVLRGMCLVSAALALVPVLEIIGHAVSEGTHSYRQDPAEGWFRHVVNASGLLDREEGTVRWTQVLASISLVAFALFASPETVTTQLILGVAVGLSSLAASSFGSETFGKVSAVAAGIIGVASIFVLSDVTYACQTEDTSYSAVQLAVGICVLAYAAVKAGKAALNNFGTDYTQKRYGMAGPTA